MEKKRIYLDNSAGTPIDKDILAVMNEYYSEKYSNPSSIHESGRLANKALNDARARVAKTLNALESEIIFTGSGTESDNLAILGLKSVRKKIIISNIEHKAVSYPARELFEQGKELIFVPVNKKGIVDLKKLSQMIDNDTYLVSIMYANNEIGTIQPIKEISEIIKKKRGGSFFPIFHTDACQVPGLLTINTRELGIDMMTINGGKIYGPKGVGALYVKQGIPITPIIIGGGQEKNIRSGTENLPAIVAFSYALEKAEKDRKKNSKKIKELRDYFLKELEREIPDLILNGDRKKRLQNNINISIPNIEGESMLLMLDQMGISVSTGSACASASLTPSHVLSAIGVDSEIIHGSIRFSLGKYNTKDEIDYTVKVFSEIVKKLKAMSPLSKKK